MSQSPESTRAKDHRLGVTVVCDYLAKAMPNNVVEIVGATDDLAQNPQIVATLDGVLTFILVRTARYPDEAVLDESLVRSLREHASAHQAAIAFAPVGLWPTGDLNEDGEEGFHVKLEGVRDLS